MPAAALFSKGWKTSKARLRKRWKLYAERLAAPVSDVSASQWVPSSGSDLYAMLDEQTYSDSDYIYSSDLATAILKCDTVLLSTLGLVKLYVRVPGSFTAKGRLKCSLYQGHPDTGTLVASVNQYAPASNTYSVVLTPTERALITNGSELYFKIQGLPFEAVL